MVRKLAWCVRESAPAVSGIGRAEEVVLSVFRSGGPARAFGLPATPAVSALAVVLASAEGLHRGEASLPPAPLPVSPEVMAANCFKAAMAAHPPLALPSPSQPHVLCSAAPSPASFRRPRGLRSPQHSGSPRRPPVGGRARAALPVWDDDRQAPRAGVGRRRHLAGAMGPWALRAALLCLGGALVFSELHTPHRDGPTPAQEEAGKPGPEARAPEEEEPFTKGCGIAPLRGALEGSRIIGGTRAAAGAWPWLVSLQVQDGDFLVHICGGALVRERWVLTAAHCTKEASDPLKWRAVLGTNDLSRRRSHIKNIQVVAIITRPDFILETFVNDIALFRLRKAVRYNDYIQPICLPFGVFQKLDQNTECFISGWGRTKEEGNGTNILQEAKVHFISREVCNSERSYGGVIPSTSFCAGHENGTFDTCRGDSGGPLMCYLPEYRRYFVMGITSYGHGCGRRHFPGVYSGPAFFQPWLTEHFSRGSTMQVFHADMGLGQILVALVPVILLGVT